MAEATVRFDLGAESVTVHLPVDLPSGVPQISGNISGVLGDAHIVGDLNLTGDVFSEGLLTGIDTFHVQGNGFVWFFQNGGRADLHGKVKAPWGPWGTSSTGWVAGDRIAVAPTKVGIYVPSVLAWSNWSVTRPANSLDVTLVDGTVRKPEVVNLSQTIVFENLGRGFHIHDSGGTQLLSDVKFLNCGTVGVLGNYPHHFHMVGENARGSLLERVVVEGGKNHAYVPHASHGITYKDCVAYNTTGRAYWWDEPPPDDSTINDTDDVDWDHCLAMWVTTPVTDTQLTGFQIGAGNGNRIVGCVATCVHGGKNSSGFVWSENSVWDSSDLLAHNVKADGIFTWTNSPHPHLIEGFTAYHVGRAGIEHGAYRNRFTYRNVSLTVKNPIAVNGSKDTQAIRQHANAGPPGLVFENITTDDRLIIDGHGLSSTAWTVHRNCRYTKVVYVELGGSGPDQPSLIRYEDCGLVPADFNLAGIMPGSLIHIVEGGVVTHVGSAGGWS